MYTIALIGCGRIGFKHSEKPCGTALALPIFPELTEDEIGFVCESIKEFYR